MRAARDEEACKAALAKLTEIVRTGEGDLWAQAVEGAKPRGR